MQPPHDQPSPAGRWVPFAEALSILNQTETTLRRMIREGRVTAEKRRRNPDSATDFREVYEVFIPGPPPDPPSPATDSESAQPPVILQQPPDTYQEIATGLLERLAAQDATIAAKDAEIARINAQALLLAERAARAEGLAAERAGELERLRARSIWKPWTW